MTIEEQFEQKNIQNIIKYNKRIEKILNQAARDLAKKISVFELKYPTTTISKNSFYLRNKGLKGKIDTILTSSIRISEPILKLVLLLIGIYQT